MKTAGCTASFKWSLYEHWFEFVRSLLAIFFKCFMHFIVMFVCHLLRTKLELKFQDGGTQ